MKIFAAIKSTNLSFKKYKGVDIVSKRKFEKYRKELEEQNKYVSIVRNTSLKRLDEKKIEKQEEVLFVNDTYFNIKKNRTWFTAGYIPVGETQFVKVETNTPLFLLFLLGLLLSLLFLLAPGKEKMPSDDTTPSNPSAEITVDDSATDWTGETPNMSTSKPQENIIIPGFYKFVSTEEAKYVPLYNIPDNTVYFEYNIFEVLDTYVVGKFDTELEANEYVKSNEIAYMEVKDDSGVRTVKMVNGEASDEELSTVPFYTVKQAHDKYTVTLEDLKIIDKTDAILPGKQVMWDPYEHLSTGTYNLKFKIKTYDLETKKEHQGTYQPVTGILE